MKTRRRRSHEPTKLLMGVERLLLLVRIYDAIDADNQGVPRISRGRLTSILRKHARVDLDSLSQAIWESSIWGEMSALALLLRPNRRALKNAVLDVTRLFLQRFDPWPTLKPLAFSVASGRITADMFQRRTRRPVRRPA